MAASWEDLLQAFLHDPPDKALDIRGHEARAARYASTALGEGVDTQTLKREASVADQLAAIAERLPMPTAGREGERAVGVSPEQTIEIRHPLSGSPLRQSVPRIDEQTVSRSLKKVVSDLDPPRLRFLAVWRLLPERLEDEVDDAYARIPADTRVPDHTIWHHADIAAGLRSALSETAGMAFLSFHIGPVQEFIAAARTLRDLWSGSAILSWLTFRAMLPVLDRFGPTAFVYPALRGAPLVDMWLVDQGLESKVPRPTENARQTPCFPNRFLAIVPCGRDGQTASATADECEQAAHEGWQNLAEAVRSSLRAKVGSKDSGWDRRWESQISGFFTITTTVLPERECSDQTLASCLDKTDFAVAWPDAGHVRRLAEAIPTDQRPGFSQGTAGRWQAQVDLAARLMQAARAVPHARPDSFADATSAPKCSLFGTYEQMGPDGLEASRAFWQSHAGRMRLSGVRLRRGERLCAPALVKRFAVPAFFQQELGLGARPLRFPDTATLAAAEWLERAGIDPDDVADRSDVTWSGQWLHWRTRDEDPDEDPVPESVWEAILAAKRADKPGPPPAYYAVLAMDADDMGGWLRGEKAPRLRDVIHPAMTAYYEGLASPSAKEGLEARRPVGPALHAAISEALTNFAVRFAPAIVRKHQGALVYAGGDDLLALLPAKAALSCAHELRLAFSGDSSMNGGAAPGYYRLGDRDLLTMGERASLSAGIAVVHYKSDLRQALSSARSAEGRAKRSGRDALDLMVMRRSGEHASSLCPWSFAPRVTAMTDAFAKGASARWAYTLRSELPTLRDPALPKEAVAAEIRRLVDRTEDETRGLFGEGDPRRGGDTIAAAFREYLDERRRFGRSDDQGDILADFVALCQSAAFLARAHES